MRKTIKDRCEYLNRTWNRPRKYETHVGMSGLFKTSDFFLTTNEPRTWSGGKWSCMCTHTCIAFEYTCLFAYFCDVTVTTTRRKIITLCNIGWLTTFLNFFSNKHFVKMHQHITNGLYKFVPINRLSWASSNCIFTMAVY